MTEGKTVPFTSTMTRWEYAAALGYLPVHIYLLPRLLLAVFGEGLGALEANVACYSIAAAFLFLCLRRFFFREYNALCDYGPGALLEIAKSYGFLLLCNLAASLVLLLLTGEAENPNNEAVLALAGEDLGKTAAVAVFLAPIAEEAMFRGGIFGALRKYSRAAAYAVTIAFFALYHIWGFALEDPTAWVYLLQYLPAGFLLARLYEKTNSLWASIFLHMTVNGVSMLALATLGRLI